MDMSQQQQHQLENGNGMSPEELSKLNFRLKSQFAGEFIQMMTEAMESKCFTKCFKKPGNPIDKSEDSCLVKCMDRFMESWSVVGETVSRIQEKINENNSRE